MKKQILKIFFIILLSGLCIWIFSGTVHAASISIKASSSSAKAGSKVTITVSSSYIGRVNLTASNGTLSTSAVWVEGNSVTAKVTVGKSGSTKVTATPKDMSSSSGKAVSVSSASTTIKISGSSSSSSGSSSSSSSNTKSSNANLSNLGVSKYDFSGFKSGTTTYNTTVPNSVTSVSVYAKTQATGATYKVSGASDLDVGTNKVTVTVTAPDKKTTKKYYIYVARKAASNEKVTPNVIDEDEEDKEEQEEKTEETKAKTEGLLSIAIEDGYEIYLEPEFKTDVYEYTINLKEDVTSIPLSAIPSKENAEITILGNENLQEGENTITVQVTDPDTKEIVTYTILVNKDLQLIAQNLENYDSSLEQTEENQFIKAIKENWVLIVTILAATIAIIATVVVHVVRHKKDKEFFEDNYQATNSIEDIAKEKNVHNLDNEDTDKVLKSINKRKGKHF